MEINEVYTKIKAIIVDACDIEESEVAMDKTLIDDLEIDSIDLMDIIYSLEREFSVSIEIGSFETIAQSKMGDKKLHVDGVITKEGFETLKEIMPEVPTDKFVEGLTIHKLPYLFTVHSLCNLVIEKQQQK